MAPPVFVLVPGSFSSPEIFETTIKCLTSPPYSVPSSDIHTVRLASTDSSRAQAATMYDDAAAVASTVEKLADEGKDVVLAMSSYGGFPGSEAAHGLGKSHRTTNGLQGGIIGLVYIAAFMPRIGQTTNFLTTGMPGEEEYMSLEYSPEFAQAVFFDLPTPEEQEKWFRKMTKHSRKSFGNELKREGWREAKCYYFHTRNDFVVSPDLQRRMIEDAKAQGAEVEVVESDAGHVPMLGRETEVADLLMKAAGLESK